MRIMALDYGKKRTGVAVTDPLQIIANGLTTVESRQLLSFIKDYVQREAVERFVVGYPLQTTGEASENLARVKSFAGELAKEFPNIPIEFYDERYTSKLAQQTMLASGIGKKRRQDKALVDAISATIILQNYMESRRGII